MSGFAPPAADPQGPDPTNEEALFEVGFRDMAYAALGKASPELMENVATFRILQKDVETGEALGAFILKYEDEILFVPVVLVDNNVKPLDVMYVRSLDRYYPLTEQFLRFVSNQRTNRMGRAVTPPSDLPTDVDLRNMVVPPSTGRYSFASWDHTPDPSVVIANLGRELPPRPDFPSMVRALGSEQKTDMVSALERSPKIAQLLMDHYGVPRLRAALTPSPIVKVAAREVPLKRDVVLLTASMPLQEMQRELEPNELAYAFGETRKHGFHIVDRRTKHAELEIRHNSELRLITPTTAGLYRVFMADGRTRPAAVFPRTLSPHREDLHRYNGFREQPQFLVLFADREYAVLGQLIAEDLTASTEEFISFLREHSEETPSQKGEGAFVSWNRLHFQAIAPGPVAKIARTDKSVTFEYHYCHRVLRVPRAVGNLIKPAGQDTILMGQEWRYWPVKTEPFYAERDFLLTERLIRDAIDLGQVKTGALRLQVDRLFDRDLRINGQRIDGLPNAVYKLATDYGLSVADAASVVLHASTGEPYQFWIKTAEPPADPQAQGPGPQDPNAPGMPVAPPPQPSGLDLAIAERQQLLGQQMQALTQEMQSLQELSMRAQMIDAGGGALAAPQGMTGMMGLPPATIGGMPAMAPTGQQGMPQGMPQGMQQGMPQGMPQGPLAMSADGQPAPPPMMNTSPTARTLPTQLNPAFLQDAALLQDPTVFDAAAVATLATPRALQAIAQSYLPTLDAAVDKLGRSLLLTYTQTQDLRAKLGDEVAQQFEVRIHDVFHGLSDVLLMFHQNIARFNAPPVENALL